MAEPRLAAVLFDVDFTLAKPGPDLGPEGYQRLGRRFGLELDPSRYADARVSAVETLERHPELDHDEEVWVLFTERIIRGMGGDADGAYECAVAMTRAWERAEHFELYDDVLPVLADLRARGLLEDTLVVWAGEFGRSPYDQDISLGKDGYETYGRGHNPYGFSAWLAGGGIKGGTTHGSTDEIGYAAAEGKTHVHDIHATILHLLGLDHTKLTYPYGGRDMRLTDVHGTVIRDVLA